MNTFIKHMVYPFMLIIVCGPMDLAYAEKPTLISNKKLPNTSRHTWYDGNKAKTIWLNPNLIAEFDPKPANHRQSKKLTAQASLLKSKQRGMRLWRLKAGNTSQSNMQQLKQTLPTGRISPVLHDGPSESTHKRALPGNIIVHLDPSWDARRVKTWFTEQKLEMVKPLNIGKNIFVIKTAPGLAALEKANAIYLSGQAVAAYPDWWQQMSKK